MEEAETDESQLMDMAVEQDHEDGTVVGSLQNKSPGESQNIVMNEYVAMLWSEERRQFDVKMQQLYEKLDPKSKQNRKMKRGTDSDFMDHLLDVHRSWCKACRPAIDRDKNNRILQKGNCVEQATQTLSTIPGIVGLGYSGGTGTQPIKPMPPLAKIQLRGEAQKNTMKRDPSTKGPNIKVIKIIKSKSGLMRQETSMTQESLKDLMHAGSGLGGPTFKAAQPLQEVKGSGSSLPQGSYVLQGKRLLTSSGSQGRPIKVRVVPVKKGQSNITPSSLASGVVTMPSTVSNPSPSTLKESHITSAGIGASSAETVNPAASMEAHRAPGVVFSQAKCVDEDDNDEDEFYDDGNVKFDDEEKSVDQGKRQSDVTEHADFVFTVKEEPLSDTEETPNLGDADKEGWSIDQIPGQEPGAAEPEVEGQEEEEEEFTEDEEEEEDEEVDFEALERKDPSYEPPSRKHKNMQNTAKDRSSSDKPGTSADLSEDDQDNLESSGSELNLESSGSEWNVESEEDTDEDFDGDFDEELEDKPSPRPKPRLVPCVCPVCSTTCKSAARLTNHLQTHLPLDKGWETIKEAIESIEAKFGKKYTKYTKPMGWCKECDKFCHQLTKHNGNAHKPREKSLCVQCGKVVWNVKMHQLTHLEVDESDYVQCPKCPAKFKHKSYVKYHIQKVHSKNTFVCPTCGKDFKARHYLRRHEVIHNDVKPFPCSLCDLSFTQASNLKIHMRQHTGDKPYACDLCEMAFTNKVSLKKHKKKLHGIDWWKERELLNKKEPEESGK